MVLSLRNLLRGTILAAAVGLPSLASAQPLAVTVNPFAVPGQIVSNPLGFAGGIIALPGQILGAPFTPPPPDVYNPGPAKAAAVAITDDLYGVVPYPVLRATGPRFDNPPGVSLRRAVVLRRGSMVPGYVTTAPMRNVSVPGLAPNGSYEFFVAPSQKVVVLDSSSRSVVRILR